MQLILILLNWIIFNIKLIKTQDTIQEITEPDISFGHLWSKGDDKLTVYFNITNSTFGEYRYYYFDLRPFAAYDSIERFPRQRLIDTQNSLSIIGIHENDYVSCVSFVDDYENAYRPRDSCYEFTIGEKSVGSHHAAKSGYLAPLLLAVAFVIHVIIVIVHYLKSQNYAQRLLQRFIDVNPKPSRTIINVKKSLKQLDHQRPSASVQRRLSRVSVDVTNTERHSIPSQYSEDDSPIYVLPRNRKVSVNLMKPIPEHHP